MKRALTLFTAAGLAANVAFAKPMASDDISNMIIKGDNRLKVSAPPIEVAWAPALYRDVPFAGREEGLVGGLKTPAITEPQLKFPATTASVKTASPWLTNIHTEPILTLATKPSAEKKKVTWTFLVKDSAGQTFFEQKQMGLLPESIEWSGFGKNGQALAVGKDYTYSLSIIDEGGNPQRYGGKPFSIPAFRTDRGGRSVTSVSPKALFEEEASARFSKPGLALLTEVKDGLRSQFNRRLEVIVYDPDPKFALVRATAVAKNLAAALGYADERVEAKAGLYKGPEGYPHVEITAK